MFHGLQVAWKAMEREGEPNSSDKPDSFSDLLEPKGSYLCSDESGGVRLSIQNARGERIYSFLEHLKAQALAKGKELSVVEFSCHECYLEAEQLSKIIAFCGSSLEVLDLSNSYLGDKQIEPIKEAKSLKRLCINYNPDLSDDAIQALEKSLSLEHALVVVRKDPSSAVIEGVPDPWFAHWTPSQSLQSAQFQQDSIPPVPVQPAQQRTFSNATTEVYSLNHETGSLVPNNDEPWSQQSNVTLVFTYTNSQQAVPEDDEATQVHSSSHSARPSSP